MPKVITAMSEDAPLHANLAAPPLAAIQRSSSDKILAAVTDEDILGSRVCVSEANDLSAPRVG